MFLNPRRIRAGVSRAGSVGCSQGRRRLAAASRVSLSWVWAAMTIHVHRSADSGVRSLGRVQPSVCFSKRKVCSKSKRRRNRCQRRCDSAQAIYHWRGAADVMTGFDGTALTLSKSFRFGPFLATEANRWLRIAHAPIRLRGTDAVPTELGPVTRPDAVLCRTNVGAMLEVMTLLAAGDRVALAGGGEDLRALALAARDLKEGRRTSHPELVLFPAWGELQDYAAHDPSGGDLQPLVDLVDTHGTDTILNAIAQLAQEPRADVTISTAHKAKGREWREVRIAEDFTPPRDSDQTDDEGCPVPGPIDDGEARLAYVAVTRARSRLDLGGLSWIHDHPAGAAGLKGDHQGHPRA